MTSRATGDSAVRRLVCFALALACATAVPAHAQRARQEAALEDERERLEGKGREELHAGDPLALVGVAEGDATALARTPALAGAILGAARVDRDELYARKLAMYEGGERFDAAPRTIPALAPAPAPSMTREPKPHMDARSAGEPSDAGRLARHVGWFASVLAAGSLLVAYRLATGPRKPRAAPVRIRTTTAARG